MPSAGVTLKNEKTAGKAKTTTGYGKKRNQKLKKYYSKRIQRALKIIKPDMCVSTEEIYSFLNYLFERFAAKARQLAIYKSTTISRREIRAAIHQL